MTAGRMLIVQLELALGDLTTRDDRPKHKVRVGWGSGGGSRGSGAKPAPKSPAQSKEWRQLRARIGGVQRALREVQAQRDAAQAQLADLHRQARQHRHDATDPSMTRLLADLRHCVDCLDPDCGRCHQVQRRIDDRAEQYATETEVAALIERSQGVVAAARAVLASLSDRGVGSIASRAAAMRALAQSLEGT